MTRLLLARLGDFIADPSNRFMRREDGTVTIFGVMMFILMVVVGGIAVDIMRYEAQRAQLQYTLDRAILAAAALDQTLAPEAVVRDYFARSGLTDYRLRLDVQDAVNARTVSATAEMDINTMFMDMFGIRALTSPAYGQAQERVQNVEISMVLDVSGSMSWNAADGRTKLENLQEAANNFVDLVMANNDYVNDDMLVSISIVPYNGFVNAGSEMDRFYNISNEHSASNCTRFRPSLNPADDQFARTSLGEFETIQRLSHFDYSYRNYYSYFNVSYCPTNDLNSIVPWSHSIGDLQAEINAFTATGWTAIDQGMRWGVTLLDPSSSDELDRMGTIGNTDFAGLPGTIHPDFSDRPEAYTDDDTLKIIVLMTDGENTEQWDVNDAYRTGGSGVWYNQSTDRWSIFYPPRGQYYIPPQRSGDSTTFNNPGGYWRTSPLPGSSERSWQWMWANFTEWAIARAFFYYPAYYDNDYSYYNSLRDTGLTLFSGLESSGQAHIYADQNLRDICDAARDPDGDPNTDDGILIFSVAFEAPDRGQDVLRYCATGDATDGGNRYYEVEGFDIVGAFENIASTINALRLTQ